MSGNIVFPRAPVVPPTVPTVVGQPTSDTIVVQFDTAASFALPACTYSVRLGAPRPEAAPFPFGSVVPGLLTDPLSFTSYPATQFFGTIYRATITGLSPMTTYFCQSVASNAATFVYGTGTEVSQLSEPITTSDLSGPIAPPSGPPTVPVVSGSTTTSSITVTFDVAGITGTDVQFSAVFGQTTSPTAPLVATLVTGTTYQAVASGLLIGTDYYFKAVASNSSGTSLSAVSAAIQTAGGAGTPPSAPPTVPAVSGTPTSSSITVTFDVAGITGTAPISFNVLYGTTASPATQASASLVSGTTYQAVVSGLTSNTAYYFKSVAVNAAGSQASAVSAPISTAGTPPGPSSLKTNVLVTFLLYSSATSCWIIDTAANPALGNWFVTGPNAGQIQNNTGAPVIPYLQSLQAAGVKVLLSIGGSGANATLGTMFANTPNFAQSFANCFLGATSAPNPLGFVNTAWSGFAFDGFDLDMEANTPAPSDFTVFCTTIQGLTLPKPCIKTMAPQAPNLVAANAFGGNANGLWYPFPHAYPSDTLANFNTGPTQGAIMGPDNLAASGMDYMFVQFYNQGPSWYPGTTGTSFGVALAMWGWLCVASQATIGVGCKVMMGWASTDGDPIWNAATDTAALQAAIAQANTLIVAQGGRYSGVTPLDWLAGSGFWNSPTANSVIQNMYANNALSNMPADATMLYCNNQASPQAPGWTGPIPVGRT